MRIKNTVLLDGLQNGSYSAIVERPIAALLFVFTLGSALPFANILKVFDGIATSVEFTTKDAKTHRMYNRVPLGCIAEYHSHMEGAIPVATNDKGQATEIALCVPICDEGALVMQNDETITFLLEKLDSLEAGTKLDIYGLEAPVRDFGVNMWHKLSVPTGTQEKDFKLNNHDVIVFPDSDSLIDVQLNYTNSTTVTYTLKELRVMQEHVNDLVLSGRPKDLLGQPLQLSGYSGCIILDVETANLVKITTVEDDKYNCFAITQKVVAVPSDAEMKNLELTSTTANVKVQEMRNAENGITA